MAKSGRELAQDLRNVREVLRGNMLYNPLTRSYVPIATSPGDESLEVSTPEGRLRYVKRLHDSGLIDDTVYQDAQQAIVAGLLPRSFVHPPREAAAPQIHLRA